MTTHPITTRDVVLERDWTATAARAAGVDAARLSAFAEGRAGDGLVRDLPSRDFATEVLEELADARNYLAWWDQQIAGFPTDDQQRAGRARTLIAEALAGVAAAFEKAEHAQLLARDLHRPVRLGLAAAIDASAAIYPNCRCPVHAGLSDEELIVLGGGCTEPVYCCPRLAAIRRRVL